MKGKKYIYKGGEYTIKELTAFSEGLSESTIRMRIRYGWPVDTAVELPKLQSSKQGVPACGATSFYDCFECRLKDCIVGNVYFDDNPLTDPVGR